MASTLTNGCGLTPGTKFWSRRRNKIFTGVSPRPITTYQSPPVQQAQAVWIPSGQLWHCSSGWPAWQQCKWGQPVAVAVWAWQAAPGWSFDWKDWCQEKGCSEGAAPAWSWDSPASQGWSGLMGNEVWLWTCTAESV